MTFILIGNSMVKILTEFIIIQLIAKNNNILKLHSLG